MLKNMYREEFALPGGLCEAVTLEEEVNLLGLGR